MQQPTPASDVSFLRALSSDSLAEITRLLKQKRPRKSAIESSVPEEFLRALFIYVRVLSNPETPESMMRNLADVGRWFESSFPDLVRQPGFDQFMEFAERAMEGYQLVPTEDSTTDVMMESLLASVGNITGFTSQQALTGPSFTPTLRVFLFHNDKLLLDSTGDWDDWLQLVKHLLASLDGQATSLSKHMEVGEAIKEELSAQLDEIERRITSLRRFFGERSVAPRATRRSRGAKSDNRF